MQISCATNKYKIQNKIKLNRSNKIKEIVKILISVTRTYENPLSCLMATHLYVQEFSLE